MSVIGIDDNEFIRSNVPMTKAEIRVLTLAKARIGETDVVYDIGAGTGSITVEAALIAKRGRVYAVEKNAEGAALIRKNAEKFGATNITVIESVAPDGMEDLPPCDAAIIGGSGKNLAAVLDATAKKLKAGGRLAVNAITVQTLNECIEYMRASENFSYEAILAQITRLKRRGDYDMAEALNPIWIVTCEKK